MEERRLTLRNHIELFADELGEIESKLVSLIKDVNAVQGEWIDDDILIDMCDLFDDVHGAASKAWSLENICQEREMGKWRF